MKIPQAIAAFLVFLAVAIFFILPSFSYSLPLLKGPQKSIAQEIPTLGQYPQKSSNYLKPPPLSARAATVIDNKTGITLYELNPDQRLLPASTTKLMTALVALQNCTPQTTVIVGFVQKEGAAMGLSQGDSVTVENLIYGLLIPSGNDAAYVLGYSCAPSYADFIREMNDKAQDLKMTNSHFVNPAGYDDPMQYSTASDLTKLARAAVANPLISKVVATKSIVVTDTTGLRTYYLENVNKLLGVVNGIEGVKTGQTEGALENLVTKTTRDNHTIITVVLGSLDRFGESQALIEWAYQNFIWQNPT